MQLSKILVFGGSFDPIHVGHTNMLLNAINKIEPSLTYVVPNYITPDKNLFHSSCEQRLEMINLAIKNLKNVQILDFEIKQHKSVKTWNTIQYLRELHPDSELYLLIGSDQLINFENWYEYKQILNNVKLVVYPRLGFEMHNKNFEYIKLNGVQLDISSTKIREMVEPYQLNTNVLEYINDNGIYGIERIKRYESEYRFNHSLRVAYMAKELMNIYKPEWANLAYTAGIYHDIAKEMEAEKQIYISENILGIFDFESYKVLHGYVGSYFIKSKYMVNNKLILNAIDRHTLPFAYYENEPNILDKVLYLADKLEPYRTNEDVFGKSIEYYRELAKTDINQCFIELYTWLQQNLKEKK